MIANLLLHSIFFLAAPSVLPPADAAGIEAPTLILNIETECGLPKNFRTTQNPLQNTSDKQPSTDGLKSLNASASGQFSEKSLNEILKKIPSCSVLIVDLRQESHGFVDGLPVSWYGKYDWANVGKNLTQIYADERFKLQQLQDKHFALVFNHGYPLPLYVKNAIQEETLTASKGLGYKRIPVTDHCKPTNEAVDEFIALVRALPPETWLHFHCAAGRGRSTTFIVMYDMIKNAKHVSFDDITLRQNLIGGMDLMKPPHQGLWKYPHLVERQKFLKEFYRYCKEADFKVVNWTEWVSRQ